MHWIESERRHQRIVLLQWDPAMSSEQRIKLQCNCTCPHSKNVREQKNTASSFLNEAESMAWEWIFFLLIGWPHFVSEPFSLFALIQITIESHSFTLQFYRKTIQNNIERVWQFDRTTINKVHQPFCATTNPTRTRTSMQILCEHSHISQFVRELSWFVDEYIIKAYHRQREGKRERDREGKARKTASETIYNYFHKNNC